MSSGISQQFLRTVSKTLKSARVEIQERSKRKVCIAHSGFNQKAKIISPLTESEPQRVLDLNLPSRRRNHAFRDPRCLERNAIISCSYLMLASLRGERKMYKLANIALTHEQQAHKSIKIPIIKNKNMDGQVYSPACEISRWSSLSSPWNTLLSFRKNRAKGPLICIARSITFANAKIQTKTRVMIKFLCAAASFKQLHLLWCV